MKRHIFVLISFALAGNLHAKPPSGYVIPDGMEQILLEIAKIDSATLTAVRVDFNKVLITYEDGKARVELALVHPSYSGSSLFVTKKFAVVSVSEPSPSEALLSSLRARITALEDRFEWAFVGEAKREPDPAISLPILGLTRDTSSPILLGVSSVGETPVLPPVPLTKDLQGFAEKAKRESDPRKLRKIASEILKVKDGQTPVKRLAAFTLRRAKDFSGALSLLDDALRDELQTKNRVDPMLLIERLACLLATESKTLVREALETMQSVYRFDPDCAVAEGIDVLLREGLKDIALKVSKGMLEGNKVCQLRVAMRLYGAHRSSKGVFSVILRLIEGKKTALDLNSEELDLLFGCAEYFTATKEFHLALRCADLLVKKDPSYPNALEILGSLYIGAGFLTRKSLEAMILLAKERKDDLVASYLAGLGLYYAERYKECIPFLEPVVKNFPNESRPAMYLAMAYFFAGDTEKALNMLEALEPFAKSNIDIYYCRSLVYREFDRQRAIEELEKFLTASIEEGRLHFAESKVEKAKSDLEALRRGEVPSPHLPSHLYMLWE